MTKKYIIVGALVSLIFGLSPVLAAKPVSTDIPEVDGVYDVAGHPHMKVRVFVHKANAKPGSGSSLQCGLADPASAAVDASAGWVIPTGNWTYRLNPAAPGSLGSNVTTIVANSFATWMGISDLAGKVNLIKGANTSANRAVFDGQNIIAWGHTSGSALGVTYIWYQSGVAIEIDTIMNNKFAWNWSSQTNCAWTNVYDAQNILTHELGHWFGLDDHYTSDYANNTMYGYGSKVEVKKNTLTAGDIAGIQNLY